MVGSSDHHLDRAVFNQNLVGLNFLWYGKAISGADVKLPAVQTTLNHMFAEKAVGQGRALVRTGILGRIEFPVDLVKSNLTPVWKKLCRATSVRYVSGSAYLNRA